MIGIAHILFLSKNIPPQNTQSSLKRIHTYAQRLSPFILLFNERMRTYGLSVSLSFVCLGWVVLQSIMAWEYIKAKIHGSSNGVFFSGEVASLLFVLDCCCCCCCRSLVVLLLLLQDVGQLRTAIGQRGAAV